MMLAAGKRVLCEKPMSLTAAGVKTVVDFAHQQQLLYVEVSDAALFYFVIFMWCLLFHTQLQHFDALVGDRKDIQPALKPIVIAVNVIGSGILQFTLKHPVGNSCCLHQKSFWPASLTTTLMIKMTGDWDSMFTALLINAFHKTDVRCCVDNIFAVLQSTPVFDIIQPLSVCSSSFVFPFCYSQNCNLCQSFVIHSADISL